DAGGVGLAAPRVVVGGDHDERVRPCTDLRRADAGDGVRPHGQFLLLPSSATVAAGGDVDGSGVASLVAMPTPGPSDTTRTTCDSCGAPDDDLAPVHRVYVTPAAWDLGSPDEGGDDHVQVLDDVER